MSPIDDTFISGSLDKTIRLWDLRSPNCHVSVYSSFRLSLSHMGLIKELDSNSLASWTPYQKQQFISPINSLSYKAFIQMNLIPKFHIKQQSQMIFNIAVEPISHRKVGSAFFCVTGERTGMVEPYFAHSYSTNIDQQKQRGELYYPTVLL